MRHARSRFDWPGNVRQLVNACRRLTVLAAGPRDQGGDLPADLGGAGACRQRIDEWSQPLASWAQSRLATGGAPLLDDAMPEFERTLLREALKVTRGGRQEAAKLLGWGRNTLTRKLKELGDARRLSRCPSTHARCRRFIRPTRTFFQQAQASTVFRRVETADQLATDAMPCAAR